MTAICLGHRVGSLVTDVGLQTGSSDLSALMFSAGAVVIGYVCLIRTFVIAEYGWNVDESVSRFLDLFGHRGQSVPVFAAEICGSHNGQRNLYHSLIPKLCGMNSLFVAQLVIELCNERSVVLELLVSALFDIDRDDEISHYEKRRFEQFGG